MIPDDYVYDVHLRLILYKRIANDNGARILFSEKPNINPAKLIELIQTSPKLYKFNDTDTLNIINELPPDANRISEITDVLQKLSEEKAAKLHRSLDAAKRLNSTGLTNSSGMNLNSFSWHVG